MQFLRDNQTTVCFSNNIRNELFFLFRNKEAERDLIIWHTCADVSNPNTKLTEIKVTRSFLASLRTTRFLNCFCDESEIMKIVDNESGNEKLL